MFLCCGGGVPEEGRNLSASQTDCFFGVLRPLNCPINMPQMAMDIVAFVIAVRIRI